jgi:hypothetical protein
MKYNIELKEMEEEVMSLETNPTVIILHSYIINRLDLIQITLESKEKNTF